jgi:hypothetical protein
MSPPVHFRLNYPTLSGKACLEGTSNMIEASWFLAFVVTPALVVAVGWMAVVLHERSSNRHPRPGE